MAERQPSARVWLNAFTLKSAAMHTHYSNVCGEDKQHNRVGTETDVGGRCPGK